MHDSHFFVSAFIYLLSAVFMVPVAKRLGLGSVLGYLIGGALIGPYVLGWVGGEQGQEALGFAEFGVVIMLFMIGLELEPARLWRLRGPVFGLGGAQVVLTLLIVAAISMTLGLAWKPALALGMILALSSTAIVIQTLQEKSLMGTSGGQDSFAVLLFQDIAVIPMLALFPLLATGTVQAEAHGWLHSLPAWAQPIVTLSAVVAIVLAGRFLVPRGFSILARTGLRELLTAAALLLIVGVALLMTEVGLSPALGAFVAGVVLAGSPYRHELESNLEPFKGLLLGLFFLAVGASLDFSVVAAAPLTVSALVLVLIVVKASILLLIGQFLRLGAAHRWLLALALAQGGEFAFALLAMAVKQNILSADLTKLFVAVVALSMALTPLLFLLYERVIAPRYRQVSAASERQADAIEEHAPVVLAGHGRFGNFIGRMLTAQGVPVTVLESDPDHVDMLRAFGFKVFYGDATRPELLHAAGLAKAKLFIITLVDRDKVEQLIHTVRSQFPSVRILARANDYDHLYELHAQGLQMQDIIHEHMGSGVELAVKALRALGYPAFQSERAARKFRKHDEETRELLTPVQEDMERYASIIRERRIQLSQLFQLDRTELDRSADAGWHIDRG